MSEMDGAYLIAKALDRVTEQLKELVKVEKAKNAQDAEAYAYMRKRDEKMLELREWGQGEDEES